MKEKIPFFKKMIISIKDFERYPELAAQKPADIILYIIKLIAIFTLIIGAISIYNISIKINDGISYFQNEIPNVKFVDNVLQVESEKPIKIKNENSLVHTIIIDTNEIDLQKEQEYTSEIKSTSNGIAFLKDKLLINLGEGNSTIIQMSYQELAEKYNIQKLDKQDIMNYFSGTNLILIYVAIFLISYIYLFFIYLISIFMDAVLLAILGYFTAMILRLRLRFMAMCNMAIHALTLPVILNLIYIIIQTFTGFEIKYFEAMYIGIAYVYIIASILIIKSDVIKKQQELSKIIEEQERIKQEMDAKKQEEEEEKRKQQEEKDRKEQEEKEKKNDKKKKDKKEKKLDSEEPQGENA